ncbi:MAG: hypothetical protein UX02_C0002G0191 [Candidatus Moranbacteria bacterium GW2011_GWC1_45_18]|nr:MAG: Metallophosphoesterase [Candidatus Moranbacteria bacterium GW2011_GWC2_40_12]KKT32797.1 MAG: Metallophosphoesterase [Candidatus Moranbacteria bacterium GW2011_GWF2_44_10]KKT99872.1 MAG: hypothetical protein UX02_C0002G0191 [Candidatus Moranbacteria bacterium GW2011_GWC1_45_18]HBB36981.1 hypothetical protein [Candidatus Moranbacteria bacterium]HBU25006.1 hypothetical protein [Candidatus Moranbacteria bacterium]
MLALMHFLSMRKLCVFVFAAALFFVFSSQRVWAFSFAVLGDTQKFSGQKSGLGKSVKSLKKYQDIDFLVSLGDMCSGKKCEKKLKKWKKIVDPLNVPIYPVMGNHDFVSLGFWNSCFGPPQNGPAGFTGISYSFDFENSHFVVLSSSYPIWHAIDAAQRSWLEADLSANTKENVFVFFHAPAFPVGGKIKNSLDANPEERDAFWQIIDSNNVTAVFSGHEHIFSRRLIDSSVFPGAQNSIYQIGEGNTDANPHSKPVQNVEYFFGQKSYLVVSVDGTQITTSLFKPGGKLLNSFRFQK